MKNNRMYGGHALGIAIGITMTFLMLAGGAVAATQVSSCGTISSSGDYMLTTNLSSSSTCITITSSDVILDGEGYTINGGEFAGSYGIYVNSGTATTLTNITVENLTVTNWDRGIYYNNTQEGNILNNTANSNGDYGIFLECSSNNTLTDNTLNSNGIAGIALFPSSNNNTLTGNSANSNYAIGIYLFYSGNNTLTDNNVSNNGWGIIVDSSSNNTLIGNTASSNYNIGIELFYSGNNTLTGNTANLNLNYGIVLDTSSNNNTLTGNTASNNINDGIFLISSSSHNTLTGNNLSMNAQNGIHITSSSNNLIYNNYFNNTNNAFDDGNNSWNTTKQKGTNIVGGSYLGGNFWSDYNGTDTDGDGIGDTLIPYNSSGGIANGGDFLPLVIPSTFDFNLTATPQNQTVSPNGNALFTVTAILISGNPQNVNLSVTVVNASNNLPEPSIINSTSPSTVLPTSNSTLFIGTNSSTPNGVYNVTVTGTSGTLQRTVNVSVIVSGKPICTNPIGCSSFTVNLTNGTPITFANQINVPLKGSFVIILVNGSNFSVVDNDATDGLAVIRVIDNSFYKVYGRVTAGANMTILVSSPNLVVMLYAKTIQLSPLLNLPSYCNSLTRKTFSF